MGFLGSKRGLTPNLDALARQSVVFTHAFAQAPLTTASHATILTGTYPVFHRVNDFGMPLPAKIPDIAELFHEHGYKTAAFVSSIVLDPKAGLAPGFDRGFEHYDAGFGVRRAGESRYEQIERRAEKTVSRATAWIRANTKGPFFLWMHLYDPHDPYEPPEPYATKYAKEPYDGEIAYVDHELGELFYTLRASGLMNTTVIAVLADHGESLGQHGEKTHGVFLYDETVHVPFVLKFALSTRAGKRIGTRVQLVDVAPTLLDVASLPIPEMMQGHSLLTIIQRGAGPDEGAYSQTDYPQRAFGWSPLAAYRENEYTFVDAPKRELYDRTKDPQESKNIADSSPAVCDTLAFQLAQIRKKVSSEKVGDQPGSSPTNAETLAALGYLSGSGASSAAREGKEVDPKDKIAIANDVHDAILLTEDGQTERAIPLLERVIGQQPEMYAAQLELGSALSKEKNYREAVPVLRKATELLPGSAMAHYELGFALFGNGDGKDAASELEKTVQLSPNWTDAQFSLASIYARTDRIDDALRRLEIALRLDPQHYRANLLRGRILTLTGHPEEGLANLETAVSTEANSAEAHAFLADAYEKLGRDADAERERMKAQTIRSRPVSK